jgi:hypothetical protein
MTQFRPLHPKLGLLLIFSLPLWMFAVATGAPIDLGKSLTYVRLEGRSDDAQTLNAAWRKPALIIDLRYPSADEARNVPADLPSRPRPEPLFVLVGPGTPANALAALRSHAPALITIGLPAPGLTPDIPLAIKPENDQRAFKALDSGVPIESLIKETVVKPRFDEAALIRETAQSSSGATASDVSATAAAATPAPTHPPATAAASPAQPAAPSHPRDSVLQRAVQLDRALLALGRLSPN